MDYLQKIRKSGKKPMRLLAILSLIKPPINKPEYPEVAGQFINRFYKLV